MDSLEFLGGQPSRSKHSTLKLERLSAGRMEFSLTLYLLGCMFLWLKDTIRKQEYNVLGVPFSSWEK